MTFHGHVDSRTEGGLVRYTISGDRAFVQDKIRSITTAYHPNGYGTHFSPPKQQEDGQWTAHGSRYTSCD